MPAAACCFASRGVSPHPAAETKRDEGYSGKLPVIVQSGGVVAQAETRRNGKMKESFLFTVFSPFVVDNVFLYITIVL